MTENDSVEVALTQDELASILRICSPDALLVGGQALAFWVDRLAVPRPPELAASITTDADFIGNADIARRLDAVWVGKPGSHRWRMQRRSSRK